ncbi:MAG TPA: T9SS type A sorting domain-containing protein [Bacteroidia bacterium]|nr:T9SS type A sorting domain-containing protein [Bacteroidia bacterium]
MKKNLLSILLVCFIAFQAKSQSLVSASPNTGTVGINLTTTITGAGTTFQTSSPPNSLYNVYLQNGTNFLYANILAATITDDLHFDITFNIPANAFAGVYDLYVSYYDPGQNIINLTLPAAVTVNPPDGFVQGKVFDDLNGNGILDGAEQGIPNQTINIPGIGNQVTNGTGDYSYGVSNGNYTVNFVPNTNDLVLILPPNPTSFNVVINSNNATNNFAAVHGITSVYPDSAFTGQTIQVTIVSRGIFTPSNVVASNVSMRRTTFPYSFTSNLVTYIDTNTIIARFPVPNNVAYLGLWDTRIYLTSGYTGYHYMHNNFTVNNPPLYLTGIVFLDVDSNGIKDPAEPGIANEKLLMMPDSTIAFSDQNGDFSFGAAPGPHTISWVQQAGFLTLAPNNPASYTDTVSVTTGGHDFGLESTISPYTSIITLDPCWSGCAHPNHFGMTYQNIGSIPYNGYVYFVFDTNMIYTTANCWGNNAPPDSIIGDTLFWNIYNVLPQQIYTVSVCFSTPVGGVTINYSATIVALDGGGNMAYSATDYGTHVVSCSMDPNEKSAIPEGVFSQHYTLLSDSILYTILFQNTGTDTAYTVVIRDTIDNNFDLGTFEVVEASHTMLSEVSLQTRVAKFTFNNILLVDSNTNEGQSHGFIRYRIRPKAGTPDNTVVYNDADIYFDFNPPVTTNQTFNTLVTVIPISVSEISNENQTEAKVIPNPFSNTAWLVFENPGKELFHLKIYSVTGALVSFKNTRDNKVLLVKDQLPQGLYIYDLSTDNGVNLTRGKFLIY